MGTISFEIEYEHKGLLRCARWREAERTRCEHQRQLLGSDVLRPVSLLSTNLSQLVKEQPTLSSPPSSNFFYWNTVINTGTSTQDSLLTCACAHSPCKQTIMRAHHFHRTQFCHRFAGNHPRLLIVVLVYKGLWTMFLLRWMVVLLSQPPCRLATCD